MKFLLLTFSLLFLPYSLSFAEKQRELTAQQKQFIALYKDLQKRKSVDIDKMKDYLLYPFLAYERLKQNSNKASATELAQFIHQYENSSVADRLWPIWMKKLIYKKQWEDAQLAYSEGRGGTSSRCYYLQVKLHTTSEDNASETIKEAQELWLSGSNRPFACNGLFDLLSSKNLLNKDKVWQRIALAMDKGNHKLAKAIAKRLSSQDQQRVALWARFKHKAKKNLLKKSTRKLLSGTHPYDHTILLYGVKRISRKDTEKAQKILQKLEKNYQFSTKDKAETASYIAMQNAMNHDPYALQHLAAIPAKYRDDQSNVWMARMALRQSDWKKVGDAVDSMSEEYQQKDVWQYWKARSLAIEGNVDTALAMYEKLSHNASFYGFIAADHLQENYHSLAKPEPDRSAQIHALKNDNIAIQRALELFEIGFDRSAKREWFYALKGMNKEQKLAAAKLALEKNNPFLAIVSVAKTKDWNQVGLRFPLEFQELIKKHAANNEIPAAWVYGVTRRESAFDAKIASSAKAQGLMQLIPSTAKEVARKLKLSKLAKNDIFIPNTNIQLGSAYLKELLKRFKGNFAQASAAYNAGPHRIPKWQPDHELEASRWIESIPFNETRKYVRAVMSYTTIYDYKLNHKKGTNMRLSQRLAAITPAPRESK
ncbi:MAG: transglycosylase SLT domain-containing protein [Cocleimonas sp.]|nr:transglycosylase SLT domain-containing protein [Cocleimonas sp.]